MRSENTVIQNTAGVFLANQLSAAPQDDRVIRISSSQKLAGAGWHIFARKGFLTEIRKGRQVASIDLRTIVGLPGAYNHQNACAAYGACRALGIAPKAIEKALGSFAGLAHRSQVVGEAGGVRFINDSKATNVESALNALYTFENIRWICGGLEKDGGLDAFRGETGSVRKAYVIGREAARFAMQLDCESMVLNVMSDAVQAAFEEAQPGDTILLAPAAASFDQYDNFEQRGDEFVAAAEQIIQSAR